MSRMLKIDAIQEVTPQVRLFVLTNVQGGPLPTYTAGAHIDVDLGPLGVRSYSLIDWPADTAKDRYVIAVQREDSGTGGSKAMHDLREGDRIAVSDPANDFERHTAPNTLLLAGGIGVTPMISMATTCAASKSAFSFHYAARSRDVMAFADDLEAAFGGDLSIYLDDTNPIDLHALMAAQEANTRVYICGPKGMIDAARTAATAAGIPEDHIHIELFASPETQSGDTPFEVEISDTGDVYTIPVGKTIIEVLEEEGVDLIYDCQRGDCGICQTDVISGTPDHRDVVLSDTDRASGKVMQICVSRAKSDRLVLDL